MADSSKIGLFIQSYIEKHFTLLSQKQKAIFSYIGKEVTVRDDLYFYFTFKQILDPINITVSNTFLRSRKIPSPLWPASLLEYICSVMSNMARFVE